MSKRSQSIPPELGERGGWPAQNEKHAEAPRPAKRAATKAATSAQKSKGTTEG